MYVCVCVCVGIGPITTRERMQNLFQTAIKTEIKIAMFGKMGLSLFVDVEAKFSILLVKYRVILSVLDPRKCEYLKDYSLEFEHACMTTYLAS